MYISLAKLASSRNFSYKEEKFLDDASLASEMYIGEKIKSLLVTREDKNLQMERKFLQINFVLRKNGRNLFENGRIRIV
jgi:hypothetical protein